MKKLLLTVFVIFGSITQNIVAADMAIKCACKKKDLTYETKNADCATLCKGKGNWSGRAILDTSNKSITCVCNNEEKISVNCSDKAFSGGKCPVNTKWNGEFYSEKITTDDDKYPHIFNVNDGKDFYDGRSGTRTTNPYTN